MAEAEICPLCGDKIIFGECSSCGFILPDYSVIAAPYDLDPSNDLCGEADPAEGMFPSGITDIGNGSSGESPKLDIPSIALPNMKSLNSLGFASAKAKPAPKIAVVRYNPFSGANPPPGNTRNTQSTPKAQPSQSPPPVQTSQPTRNVKMPQTAQTVQTVQNRQNASSAPFVPYVQQASLPEQFVKGVVNLVTRNWWKALIIALVPTAGIFFALYFFSKFKEDHLTGDILTAVIFGVISVVLIFSGWDPIGLDEILQTVMRYFSDDYY